MTKTENNISLNEETYNQLISHFNQIEKSYKKKQFEWMDEELSESCFITFDFDKWLRKTEILSDIIFEEGSRDFLISHTNQLKNYIDGFTLDYCAMFEGKPFRTKVYEKTTFDEIVEYMKEVCENNKMVFLHRVYKKLPIPENWTVIENGIKVPYSEQEQEEYYVVDYGVLN